VFGGGSKQTLEREGLHGMGPPLSWSLERERERATAIETNHQENLEGKI